MGFGWCCRAYGQLDGMGGTTPGIGENFRTLAPSPPSSFVRDCKEKGGGRLEAAAATMRKGKEGKKNETGFTGGGNTRNPETVQCYLGIVVVKGLSESHLPLPSK